MDYKKEKEKIIILKEELMQKYKEFYALCMKAGASFFELNTKLEFDEKIINRLDYEVTLLTDKDFAKIQKLFLALMYIEHPDELDYSVRLKEIIERDIIETANKTAGSKTVKRIRRK